MRVSSLLVCLVLFCTTCLAGKADISEATHDINLEASLPPIDASTVKVYTYEPSPKAKVVGRIYARGMATVDRPGELDIFGILQEATEPARVTEEDDKRLAMQALVKDAAAIGADAVVVVKSYQVRVSENSTERRIEAIAFRTSVDADQPSSKNAGNCSLSSLCILQKSK